jgi:hypothetical protein
MKLPDVDRIRSEELVSIKDFLKSYNKDLPSIFPAVSMPLLKEFRQTHLSLFTHGEMWSLDQHRKKVMDWLPSRLKAV